MGDTDPFPPTKDKKSSFLVELSGSGDFPDRRYLLLEVRQLLAPSLSQAQSP